MYSDNSKIVIVRLESFINKFEIFGYFFRLIPVFETGALLNVPIYGIFIWLLLPDL